MSNIVDVEFRIFADDLNWCEEKLLLLNIDNAPLWLLQKIISEVIYNYFDRYMVANLKYIMRIEQFQIKFLKYLAFFRFSCGSSNIFHLSTSNTNSHTSICHTVIFLKSYQIVCDIIMFHCTLLLLFILIKFM